MYIDPNNPKHIIADEGKVLYRIADDFNYGKEIFMGYTYYIGGVLQDPPHKDVIEDFSEMDEPEND